MITFGKQLPQLSAQVTAYESQLEQFIGEFIEPPEAEEEDTEGNQTERGRTHRKPEVVA